MGAAIEAERVISYFDPDLILFVGVAGGFKDDLRPGDVVVGSKVYDYHGGKQPRTSTLGPWLSRSYIALSN